MMFENWQTVSQRLIEDLKDGETLALSLSAEESLFVRFTQAKVRQSTDVTQGNCELNFTSHRRVVKLFFPFTFDIEKDLSTARKMLELGRLKAASLPEDPYIQFPQNFGAFHQVTPEKNIRQDLALKCLESVKNLDFVGLLAAGKMIRANYNSAGLNQWFETANFALDFSLYSANQQAVKGLYGGQQWNDNIYHKLIEEKADQLDHLNRPLKTLEKGKYRTYFSPMAVTNFLNMMSWNGISQGAYQRGMCALKKLVNGEEILSPLFTLQENFAAGEMPRFNEAGEIAAEQLKLIENGKIVNLLCSTRTAKEYECTSNFADSGEGLRCPEILPGTIAPNHILQQLGTGIYVSDLHYLNWSDLQQGRITGMTRFGCFWVENGQIQAPIKDMRFDESLYHFWGTGLVGFTNFTEVFPELNTYGQRNLGSQRVPGMIVDNFTLVN